MLYCLFRLAPAWRHAGAKRRPGHAVLWTINMTTSLKCIPSTAIITGWDFSTSGVKCLAFDLDGNTIADVRLPTDLWTKGGVSELNLLQLEGQARASVRAMANLLCAKGRLH